MVRSRARQWATQVGTERAGTGPQLKCHSASSAAGCGIVRRSGCACRAHPVWARPALPATAKWPWPRFVRVVTDFLTDPPSAARVPAAAARRAS